MKAMLRNIAEPLRRIIFLRALLTFACLIVTAILLVAFKDFRFALPGIGLTVCLLATTAMLFLCAISGEYLLLSGVCSAVDYTLVRRHAKSITIDTDNGLVRILLRDRRQRIAVGATIDVYVPLAASVYQTDEGKTICSYITLTVTSGK